MIAYLDSSVLLRIVLGQKNRLPEWRRIERGVASALVEVECLRTLDRMRLRLDWTDDVLARRREAIYRLCNETEIIEVTRPVLARASNPLPTPVGTLDAIHLASALLFKETSSMDVVMTTHDAGLARAARASGLEALGA